MRSTRLPKDSELIAAVDIGASKAVCLIAHLAPGLGKRKIPEIVGVGRQGGAPDREDGAVSAAETALRAAVDAAERMAGDRIRGVHVAVAGRKLHCRRIGVDLDVEGGAVTDEDLVDCLRQGAAAASADSCTQVHALPIAYAVDGDDVGQDPVGLAGNVLTAEMLGVGARESHVANIEAIVESCGLRIDDLIAAPLAAAEAVLVEDERELGVVLVDIGARSTDYAVFERGALVGCGGVSLGSDHITRDIAKLFGAPLREAERIKTLYGAALVGAGDEHKLVDFPQLGDESDVVRVSRAELSAVITPRLEEILELTRERLDAAGRVRHGVRRVVLTGGGSLLVGVRETAERILSMKGRLGRPITLTGAPDAATSPQFAVCAGLIQLAARRRIERDGAGRSQPLVRKASGGMLAGVGHWLRENF